MSGGACNAGDGWALVAFTGRTELAWLRLLKPGFRHCFVLLPDPVGWVLLDPMAHATLVRVLPSTPAATLFARLLAEGLVAVPVRPRAAPRRAAPWAPFTCVEAVKRALGVRARGVWTPWQLFRLLTREEKMLDKAARWV